MDARELFRASFGIKQYDEAALQRERAAQHLNHWGEDPVDGNSNEQNKTDKSTVPVFDGEMVDHDDTDQTAFDELKQSDVQVHCSSHGSCTTD